MNARIKPVNERLAQIAEKKTRLADEWVQLNMDANKYRELKYNLEQEETRLRSMRSEIDPAQLEELEHTRSMLQFWDTQLQAMAWNTENEDGCMIRLVDKPHETVLGIVSFEEKDITKIMHFPATKRELRDLLQVKVIVFMDRVEIKAVFPIESITNQLLRPAYRLQQLTIKLVIEYGRGKS